MTKPTCRFCGKPMSPYESCAGVVYEWICRTNVKQDIREDGCGHILRTRHPYDEV